MGAEPKVANWKPGRVQICFFVRTREGNTFKYVHDNLDEPGARKELANLIAPFLEGPRIDKGADGPVAVRTPARRARRG